MSELCGVYTDACSEVSRKAMTITAFIFRSKVIGLLEVGTEITSDNSGFGRFLKQKILGFFPILEWLPKYNVRENLLNNFISGITCGIMAVPQGMAYATLTNVDPAYGLYSFFFAPFFYLFFGTSRHIAIGVFAVASMMVGNLQQQLITGKQVLTTNVSWIAVTTTHYESPIPFDVTPIFTRANRKIFSIFRFIVTSDLFVLTKCFTVFVRPILEYASVVFNCKTKGLIKALEEPQRIFSKIALVRSRNFDRLEYDERRVILSLTTLEKRRICFDIVYVYKIFNYLCAAITFKASSTRAGSHYVIPKYSTHVKNSLAFRTAPLLNKLNCNILTFKHPHSLLTHLLNFDLSKYVDLTFP
uniref:Sulfate_transp domain-containing protein n=1 Tax=Panagrellus redivivus TaxID=6233 RepID=A0A7E4USP2_PANRE